MKVFRFILVLFCCWEIAFANSAVWFLAQSDMCSTVYCMPTDESEESNEAENKKYEESKEKVITGYEPNIVVIATNLTSLQQIGNPKFLVTQFKTIVPYTPPDRIM